MSRVVGHLPCHGVSAGHATRIHKAIEESQASQETRDEAQRLRDEGEVQRKTAGQCETPLMQALELLGK